MMQLIAGDRMVIGVTRENITRLITGHPLHFKLLRSVTHVLVIYGDTKPDILRQVEAAGIEVAQAWKDAAAADPL